MRRWPARAASALAAAVIAATVTPSAAVAASGNISNIEVTPGQVSLIFEATETEEVVDPESVSLVVEGVEIPAEVTRAGQGSADSLIRTAMLVVDTSGSMNQNNRLAGAKQAARAFVAAAPDDLRIGLVTFGDDARVAVQPTLDHAAVSRTVQGLRASGSTALYDATVLAASTLGRTGVRSIVILSDGENEGSTATLGQAVNAVRSREIQLDAVAFQTRAGRAALTRLANAGKGAVVAAASAADLTRQFRAAAQRLSGQLVVTAKLPQDAPTGQVVLMVSGSVAGERITDEALALFPAAAAAKPKPKRVNAAPQPSQVTTGLWAHPNLIWVGVATAFLGLCLLLAFMFNAMVPSKNKSVSRTMALYTVGGRVGKKEVVKESTAFGNSPVAQSAVEFAGRLVARRDFEARLQTKLEAAGIALKPAEWIILHLGSVLLLPAFMFLLSGANLVLTITTLILAALVPQMFLSFKAKRRRTKFADALPETLQLMAGSLSAGYSLPQAADTVVREAADPIGTEFNRALVETRLGIPIEDALESVADRMHSKDFSWVVMAIRVQREVGGNLAELLLTVAGTLRERARLRRQVAVLSAEGRLSAWILGALPIGFSLYLLVARPSYILLLTKEPLGWLMIGYGVLMLIIGGFWMKKIVNVEV